MRNKAGAWFNGHNAFIEVPASDSLNIIGAITICAWVRREKNKPGYILIRNTADDSKRLYGIFVDISEIDFFYYDGAKKYLFWDYVLDSAEHHIVVTVNGLVATLYVDSVNRGDKILDNPFQGNTDAKVNIGRREPGSFYWRGFLSEVLLYNRALNPDEIMSLYSGSRDIRRGLVMHHDYRLGHANDLSGNGNHGIPHNVQFVGVYTKKGLWCPGQDNAYVEIPEAVINGDDDYTVAVEFADIQPGKLFQHGNDLIIELEGETLKAYRINSASEQETVTYNLPQFSGMAIARKVGNNLELLWNGVSVGSVAVTGDALPDTVWQIGNALRGNIKRVIAYQRALDNGEINQLLNRQLPPHPSLYYDFRLGHADDLSGHGRDGILHGELLWI